MLRYALWWMLKCENNWHGRVPCGSGLDHLVLMMSFLETHLSPHAMDLFLFDWLLLPLVVSGYLSFLHESWTYFFFFIFAGFAYSPPTSPGLKSRTLLKRGGTVGLNVWRVQDIWWHLLSILQNPHLSDPRAPALPTPKALRVWLLSSGMSLYIKKKTH